jgi:hypothetical protein
VEGRHPRREATLAAELVDGYGLDFYIADAEAPYKVDAGGRWGRSALFTRAFRAREPSLPAALATYGAAACTCVLPIDYAAWRRAHFALLPEAYYNQFRLYRPDRTVAHALRAGWRRSDVHPIIGVYHHYPAARYVPLLARAGTRGFSVFLADAASPGDYTALAPRIEAEATRLPTFSSPDGAAGAPVALTPPALAGLATAGSALAAAPGAWSGRWPMAASYQWQRCGAGACVTVPDATGPVYAVGPGDAGFTIRVAVEERNALGAATAYSAPTRPVILRATSPAP